MTTTRTSLPTRVAVHTVVALLAAVPLSIVAASAALAGGPPPPADGFELEAVYINCVDDEVDEPGIDGDALVRVRVTNNDDEDVTVSDGSWSVAAGGDTVTEGDYITPADLTMGATWEQVVRIPGDTGAAQFTTSIDITGAGGTITIVNEPELDVPGDCPQPDISQETTPSTDPTTPAVDDAVRPRFTG
jgi:hypothetical protein